MAPCTKKQNENGIDVVVACLHDLVVGCVTVPRGVVLRQKAVCGGPGAGAPTPRGAPVSHYQSVLLREKNWKISKENWTNSTIRKRQLIRMECWDFIFEVIHLFH